MAADSDGLFVVMVSVLEMHAKESGDCMGDGEFFLDSRDRLVKECGRVPASGTFEMRKGDTMPTPVSADPGLVVYSAVVERNHDTHVASTQIRLMEQDRGLDDQLLVEDIDIRLTRGGLKQEFWSRKAALTVSQVCLPLKDLVAQGTLPALDGNAQQAQDPVSMFVIRMARMANPAPPVPMPNMAAKRKTHFFCTVTLMGVHTSSGGAFYVTCNDARFPASGTLPLRAGQVLTLPGSPVMYSAMVSGGRSEHSALITLWHQDEARGDAQRAEASVDLSVNGLAEFVVEIANDENRATALQAQVRIEPREVW